MRWAAAKPLTAAHTGDIIAGTSAAASDPLATERVIADEALDAEHVFAGPRDDAAKVADDTAPPPGAPAPRQRGAQRLRRQPAPAHDTVRPRLLACLLEDDCYDTAGRH